MGRIGLPSPLLTLLPAPTSGQSHPRRVPSRCYSHPPFPQSLFEEMCLSLYTHMTMRGTHNSSWLNVGAIGETCGKRCMGEFCKLHSYRMRGSSILPKPCRKCGLATQSEPQLCTSCGDTVAKINMTRLQLYQFQNQEKTMQNQQIIDQ